MTPMNYKNKPENPKDIICMFWLHVYMLYIKKPYDILRRLVILSSLKITLNNVKKFRSS